MKMVKSLLLGTAAGLVAVAGAQAADMPVKAKPVQYVKICTLYGDGFYYIPGTQTCLKLGGYLRMQVAYNMDGGGLADGALSPPAAAQALYNRVTTNDVDSRIRGALSLDVRDQTEYGTLRSYFRIGSDLTTPGAALGATAGDFFDRAFIQWAGFTVGKAQSFFDTVTYGGAYSYHNVRITGDTGATGWMVWAYTAQFGNGYSATLSLEDSNRGKSVCDGTLACFVYGATALDNGLAAQGAANNGMRAPDVVVNFRVDQAWGFAGISGALHHVNGAYYLTANNVNNGHPTDKLGWAVGAGAQFRLPGGDTLGFNAQYGEGATSYAGGGGSYAILNPGTSVGLGWTVDGIFDTGTEIELTRSASVLAFYEHRWNPKWKTSWYGGATWVDYNAAATRIINSHLPGAAGTVVCGVAVAGAVWPPITMAAGAPGNSCNPDFSYYQVGSRTQWNPHPNLDIGVDITYTHLNTAYKGVGVVAVPLPQNPVGVLDDQDVLSVLFRWQRNFYP